MEFMVWRLAMNKGKKFSILGAGNVGATIAYTLAVDGMASEIVLVDINMDKAKGEALDIIQGTAFCPPVNIHAGYAADTADSDIVIITSGSARKPGQSRIDLTQGNVDIIKSVLPEVARRSPGAIYIVVSNPVDIITYAILRCTSLDPSQVIGTGTLLDTSRLRAIIAHHVEVSPKSVHAMVLGEHGDTSVVPWSLITIAGMPLDTYCEQECKNLGRCKPTDLQQMEQMVRQSGAEVIGLKGATYYAIALATRRLCDCVVRDTSSVLTVSGLTHGPYGMEDVCLSLPRVVGARGVERDIAPVLTDAEAKQLCSSADALKAVIQSVTF